MDGDNSDMEFQHDRSENMMNFPSTGMSTNPLSEKVAGIPMCSMPLYKNCSGGDPFFASGWDPIVSLNHSENFGGFANSAYPVGMGNQGISSNTSQLLQYQSSDSALVDLVPKLSCFGSGSFSEMVNSFGFPEGGQAAKNICTQSYPLNKEGGCEKPSTNSPLSQEDCPISGNGGIEDSPNGKRKKRIRDPHSAANPNKHAEVEQVKDMSEDSSGFQNEQDNKKSITERNPGSLRGKQSSKISKDNSPSGEASKENYIHVRARRGQATNSHSLAERVRREKISERMRMLQELVPGCNKITGKAVMLDEIINYVQSLQQQVEFLSMKLTTVNPEMSIDIERILPKDILQSRAANGAFLGSGSGMISSHTYPHGALQGTMPNIPNIPPQFHHMPQNVWDNELRNLLQMGFNSNSTIDTIGLDGCSKPEM